MQLIWKKTPKPNQTKSNPKATPLLNVYTKNKQKKILSGIIFLQCKELKKTKINCVLSIACVTLKAVLLRCCSWKNRRCPKDHFGNICYRKLVAWKFVFQQCLSITFLVQRVLPWLFCHSADFATELNMTYISLPAGIKIWSGMSGKLYGLLELLQSQIRWVVL